MALEENRKLHFQKGNQDWNEVFRLISWWDQEKMAQAKVMVIGAGALGNEVLKNLALLDLGNIIVVDFDTIEYSNLSRSVLFRESDIEEKRLKSEVVTERVKEINPNVNIQSIHGDITIDVGLGLFRRMDVVIGCLDNRLARLATNRFCHKVNKTWIDGAIENLAGQLNVYTPQISCYECQLSDFEWQNIRHKMGCPDIARRNKTQGRIPTTPISSSVIGALQVQEALKVIYQNDKQSIAGQSFQFEGMNNMFLLYDRKELKEDCMSHITIDHLIIEAPELSHHSTIREILDWCSVHFNRSELTIQLDHEVVIEVTSKTSQQSFSVFKVKPHLSDTYLSESTNELPEDLMITESIEYLDNSSHYIHHKASEFGIPPLHVIQLESTDDIYFVELTGDLSLFDFLV